LPGMFVRAQLQQGVSNDALLAPQAAVSRNARGQPTVLVVDAEGKVSERAIRTERVIDGQWLVIDGLKAGEQVIVEGLQRARAGSTVKPVPAGAKPETAAASPGQG
ncbi:MAG: HlyD family secretion protein, partial [Gammaproteobacteria bacterium]